MKTDSVTNILNMKFENVKCDWNMNIENITNVIKIWRLRMLQMWLKYEFWECYKCDWNMNIENITNITKILRLRMLKIWLKYGNWECYKNEWILKILKM